MSKIITKDEALVHKKSAIRKINALLEGYINSGDNVLLKKSNLISYWLETFCNYVSFESQFDSTRLIKYSRGDVIRINFGFNIGKELGGLHYAVILDNDNKQSADVVTVIPLSSTDGKKIHVRSVDLGTELYEKISAVQDKLILDLKSELSELERIHDAFLSASNICKSNCSDSSSAEELEHIDNVLKLESELNSRILSINSSLSKAETNKHEISKLKFGSMAVTNQITTISKQRIYTPKKSEDFLYGISLSTTAMEKINSKIIELYTR